MGQLMQDPSGSVVTDDRGVGPVDLVIFRVCDKFIQIFVLLPEGVAEHCVVCVVKWPIPCRRGQYIVHGIDHVVFAMHISVLNGQSRKEDAYNG